MPDVGPYNFGGFDLSRMYPSTVSSSAATIYSKLVATVNGIGVPIFPHHPINCMENETWDWGVEEFSCKHSAVPMLDEKLQAAINFSITELLMEIAHEKL